VAGIFFRFCYPVENRNLYCAQFTTGLPSSPSHSAPFVEQVMSDFTNIKWRTITGITSEPYRVLASAALEYIDWDALATAAEESRKRPCKVGEQYGLGGRHVVREILFHDDVHWSTMLQRRLFS
jgi:hypothetical protein